MPRKLISVKHFFADPSDRSTLLTASEKAQKYLQEKREAGEDAELSESRLIKSSFFGYQVHTYESIKTGVVEKEEGVLRYIPKTEGVILNFKNKLIGEDDAGFWIIEGV